MSLVLMIFYWAVIPVGVFQLARWLIGRTQSPLKKGLVMAGTFGFYAWFLWIAVGRNMWLDQQVREMCAKDGGVKVYEPVELTPDLIDKAGRIWIPYKGMAKPLDKYYVETDEYYFRKGQPQVSRWRFRYVRKSDGKVLGESISYGRGGGGLFGPWHGSSFQCPDPTQKIEFESAIFIKEDKK